MTCGCSFSMRELAIGSRIGRSIYKVLLASCYTLYCIKAYSFGLFVATCMCIRKIAFCMRCILCCKMIVICGVGATGGLFGVRA
jgi:hypothetical protein